MVIASIHLGRSWKKWG